MIYSKVRVVLCYSKKNADWFNNLCNIIQMIQMKKVGIVKMKIRVMVRVEIVKESHSQLKSEDQMRMQLKKGYREELGKIKGMT